MIWNKTSESPKETVMIGECHNPIFEPVAIAPDGKKVCVSKTRDFKDNERHITYKIPEGFIVISSHNFAKDPIQIEMNNPTPKAKMTALRIANELNDKYKVNYFWVFNPHTDPNLTGYWNWKDCPRFSLQEGI
jgi:hypothetical protein